MSTRSTRVIVQGLTGREGSFHAQQMIDYGTKIVAGVTPGKGGTKHLGVPVFNTVAEAVRADGRERLGDFCAAAVCRGRDSRSVDAELAARHLHHRRHSDARHGARRRRAEGFEDAADRPELPGNYFARQMQDRHHARLDSQAGPRRRRQPQRHAHLRSRRTSSRGSASGNPLASASAAIRSSARRFSTPIRMFNDDPDTHAIVMIGEIGGNAEEIAAAFIKKHVKKPVVGFIAGQTAPPGRRMGHAGAIISGGQGTAAEKYEAMRAAGIHTVQSPAEIGQTLAAVLGKSKSKPAESKKKPAARIENSDAKSKIAQET